jgi:hypothetical protein
VFGKTNAFSGSELSCDLTARDRFIVFGAPGWESGLLVLSQWFLSTQPFLKPSLPTSLFCILDVVTLPVLMIKSRVPVLYVYVYAVVEK